MNSLEKIINGIYQKRLQKKKERKERKEVKQEKQERNEKIYKAISDFIRKDDVDIRKYKSYDEYAFNLGKTKIVVEVTDCGEFSYDYRAAVSVNSIKLDAPKWLKRQLAVEIVELILEKDEEEKEKIIKEAAAAV